MADRAEIKFVKLATPDSGSAVLLTAHNLKLGRRSAELEQAAGGRFSRAAAAAKFKGAALKSLQLLAPAGSDLDRIVFVGLGDPAKLTEQDWLKLGGTIPTLVGGRNGGDRRSGAAGRGGGNGGRGCRCGARDRASHLQFRQIQDQEEGRRGGAEAEAFCHRDGQSRRRPSARGLPPRRSRRAWRSRAISSTSRRMRSARSSSPSI